MTAPEQFVLNLEVPSDRQGERLDRLVVEHLPDTSRSFVQRLIEAGDVLVNEHVQRPSYKVSPGDRIRVHVPPPEEPDDITPADILIPIAYEDDDIVVFDKPPGLVVHPAPGHKSDTLVNAFKWLRPEDVMPGTERPGIVHRLDKDTSGLIVVAKNEGARLHLTREWQERRVTKQYVALVVGDLEEDRAMIDAPISRDPNNRKRMAVVKGGRPARTHIEVRRRYGRYTLLDVEIETGRTHQIRVHCAFIGHPIAQDRIYGGYRQDFPLDRQFLHARRLSFALPDGRTIDLESPLPQDLRSALDYLESVEA